MLFLPAFSWAITHEKASRVRQHLVVAIEVEVYKFVAQANKVRVRAYSVLVVAARQAIALRPIACEQCKRGRSVVGPGRCWCELKLRRLCARKQQEVVIVDPQKIV